MSQTQSNSSSAFGQTVSATNSVPVTDLLEQEGTVPFLGVNEAAQATYPDAVSTSGRRYVTSGTQTFKDALEVLPHAGEGELWADNEFVSEADDGSGVTVDADALTDVHGLDLNELASATGRTVDQLIAEAEPDSQIKVTTHKDIVDRRRLALRTLGYDVKFRWQIASRRYTPGNMRSFFKRKIAACEKHGATDAFGWIRHYDWGGSVTITTIYPSKAYEIGTPDETDIDFENNELTLATADADAETTPSEDSVTIYYGDRMGYDFRGHQKLWVKPVIFIPSVGTMIPLPYAGTDLSRKHTGDLMADAIDWHETILSKIDSLCADINKEITRARVVAMDFEELPFSITEFYQYLGIKNETYAEKAADRATALADPPERPTLWNLQLSLKLAILDNYSGSKAGATYQEYQELAGEILRHPATQITLAKEQHQLESDTDDTETLDAAQQTLGESLQDVMDLTGVTENRLNPTEAQKIEQRVQQRLPSADSGATSD